MLRNAEVDDPLITSRKAKRKRTESQNGHAATAASELLGAPEVLGGDAQTDEVPRKKKVKKSKKLKEVAISTSTPDLIAHNGVVMETQKETTSQARDSEQDAWPASSPTTSTIIDRHSDKAVAHKKMKSKATGAMSEAKVSSSPEKTLSARKKKSKELKPGIFSPAQELSLGGEASGTTCTGALGGSAKKMQRKRKVPMPDPDAFAAAQEALEPASKKQAGTPRAHSSAKASVGATNFSAVSAIPAVLAEAAAVGNLTPQQTAHQDTPMPKSALRRSSRLAGTSERRVSWGQHNEQKHFDKKTPPAAVQKAKRRRVQLL